MAKKKKTEKQTPAPAISDTRSFYRSDFPRTLFPLRTNLELITRGESLIKEYILRCLDQDEKSVAFLQQHRVYAAKPGLHLRRTIKLDVVSEYYLYDIIFRNRARFRKPHTDARVHYGYRFEDSGPIQSSAAYKGFRGAISDYREAYKHFLSIDVASYFNSVYHHDLVNWFRELQPLDNDIEGFGQFFREIVSGRSIDCLPQGLYPAKMIGNDFLRFIDNSFQVRSERIVRFMDDIYLFSDDKATLKSDFISVQRLLGDKGLSVNPKKTSWDDAAHVVVEEEIDTAKANLLKKRRAVVTVGYDENDDEIFQEITVKWPLTPDEIAYLNELLEKDHLEEDDAELILTIMRDHSSRVEKRLPYILRQFPNLTKNVYSFCSHVDDKSYLAKIVLDLLKDSGLMEYQLFWLGYIVEDHLMDTPEASSVLNALFTHASATTVSKAKILEIPDNRYGLPELRSQQLSTGASDWLAWSSAVGSRRLQKGSRNHVLKYFGNSSQLNHLIAKIVLAIE